MDIILKSLVSAVVTGVILLIAKFAGPKMAGAIGGIPIVFAISYILVTMKDKAIANDFLVGGVYGAIAAIFFSIILIIFNNKIPEYHWLNFAIAYVLCFLLAFVMVYFTSR